MSAYSTGSANVTVGSAKVTGSSTNFTAYVSVGNLFKLVGTDTFYTVAGVNTATRITLSSRYVDTTNQTATQENVASPGNATKLYSGTLSNTPVIGDTLTLTASETYTDDGAGVLSGTGGAGTIDYDTGAWTLALTASLNATYNAVASYYYGEAISAMPYQIVKDFTSIHSFPEMSRNDTDFATIYTRMVRSLDTKLNVLVASSCTATTGTIGTLSGTTGHVTTLTSNSLTATTITGSTSITSPKITASSYLRVGNKYIFSGDVVETSASIVAAASALVTTASLKGSLYMNTSNLWYFTATNTAATVTW